MTMASMRAAAPAARAAVWAAGAAALVLWTSVSRQASAETAPPPPMVDIGVDERVGEQIPLDLTLLDHRGAQVPMSRYFDGQRPVLMVLAYTRCAMLCSVIVRGLADGLHELAQATGELPGSTYRVITISIDPRDRPHEAARMRQVMVERVSQQAGRAAGPVEWPFMTGGEPSVRELAASLGFRYRWDPRTEQYAHPSVVFVLTPSGTISRYLYGLRYPAAQLESALAAAARGETAAGTDSDEGLLRCFRFDAVSRRFGPYVQRLFQVGALVIFGGLFAGGLRLFVRERRRGRESNRGQQ